MILANTYHLALRPGAESWRARWAAPFCGWEGPILSDSGGFQLFSLADNVQIDERASVSLAFDGNFRVDSREGGRHPGAIGGRRGDGARPRGGAARRTDVVRDAAERTFRWAERCAAQRGRSGAVRHRPRGARPPTSGRLCRATGGTRFSRLCRRGAQCRRTAGRNVSRLGFHGPGLPADKPRYLMGVGRPQDLLEAIAGASTCSTACCRRVTAAMRWPLPTTALSGCETCNTSSTAAAGGGLPCLACRHSRGYLRHFSGRRDVGAGSGLSHNLTYYQRLLARPGKRSHPGDLASFAEQIRRLARPKPAPRRDGTRTVPGRRVAASRGRRQNARGADPSRARSAMHGRFGGLR